jgi:hypothetical protein
MLWMKGPNEWTLIYSRFGLRVIWAASQHSPPGRRETAVGHHAADCCTHRVVEIGVGEAAVRLQARDNPLKKEATLLNRYADRQA